MYSQYISLFVLPPPIARLLPRTALAGTFSHTAVSSLVSISSNDVSSSSSSIKHQLCRTQAAVTHKIRFSSVFTLRKVILGNLRPRSPKALSMTDLFDDKCVLYLRLAAVIPAPLLLNGVSK